MPFLWKQPCTVSRVLSIADIPPHCEYAYYYDALYYPECHTSVFETQSSVCSWLQTGFENHTRDCSSCVKVPSFRPTGMLHVHYMQDKFMLSAADLEVYLTIGDIESASFTFCRYARLLSNRAVPIPVWNRTMQGVLSEYPPWLFRSDEHYTSSLGSVSRRDLSQAAGFMGANTHLRKAECIQLLLHDFLRQRTALLDSDLSQLVPGVIPCHPAILITHFFHRRYGPSVATALRTLTSAKDFIKPHLGLCCVTANLCGWQRPSLRCIVLCSNCQNSQF